MPLLEYLETDIDDGQFMDMLLDELYIKLYDRILEDFRHRADCTICHGALTFVGVGSGKVISAGTESKIQSPESIAKLAETIASDLAFNEEFSVAKTTAKEKAGK